MTTDKLTTMEKSNYSSQDFLFSQSAVEAEGKLDLGELELEFWDSRYMARDYRNSKWNRYTQNIYNQ